MTPRAIQTLRLTRLVRITHDAYTPVRSHLMHQLELKDVRILAAQRDQEHQRKTTVMNELTTRQ
jgi:hypothetical protein